MYKTFGSDDSEGRDRWEGFIRAGQAGRQVGQVRADRAGQGRRSINRESIKGQQSTVNSQQSSQTRFSAIHLTQDLLPSSVFRLPPQT